MKTTCKVEHRDYIPWGWIAIEFCHLKFMGDNASKHEHEWHEIEYSKCRKINQEIATLKEQKELLHNNIIEISNAKNNRKLFHRHFTKEEKLIIEENESAIYKIDSEIENKEDDKFYKATRLHIMAEDYLEKNGFSLINCSSSGNECITKTEIWERQ